MTKIVFAGAAACAAVLALAACTKPAEPAATPAAPAAATPAAAAPAAPAAPASGLPADVAALQEKFELCEHFAGEEPYDDARRKQIEEAVTANCDPVKAATPGIKAKYADNAAVMAVVKSWEELLGPYEGH